VGVVTGGQVYYIETDQLGTPRQVATTNNGLRWSWDYFGTTFGETLPNENPSGLGNFTFNLRFPGQYYDVETGTHYNYFRDYEPQTGRYAQSDPIGLQGAMNTYAYVGSAPLGASDARGLAKWRGIGTSFGLMNFGRDTFKLESECKCGKRVKIDVEVIYYGYGFGAGRTSSAVEFEDHFECPNAMAFDGVALKYSAGLAIRFGANYSRMLLGATTSAGWSAETGIEAGIGVSIGSSRILEIHQLDCGCAN
jgi:RHS repeat-associated protein